MKKVISFSVFGGQDIYLRGILNNLSLCTTIYPDWIPRVYCEKDLNFAFLSELKSFEPEIIFMERKSKNEGLFWRFLPIFDSEVDVFIVRDADSRLGFREAAAVSEWMDSGCAIHVMRDAHNHSYSIMAGMVGFKNSSVNKNCFKMNKYFGEDMGADQRFLDERIWSKYKLKSLIHDHWASTKPISSPYDIEGEVPVNEAYGVGLIPFLEKARQARHADIFPHKNPIQPFPSSELDEDILYVGQVIDENNLPVYSQDARWEYSLRGQNFPG